MGNEAAMDSISITYINYQSCLSFNNQLHLEINLLQKELEKINLKVNYLTSENSNINFQKSELQSQLNIKDQIHEADILYYKEKSKSKLNTFLFGTAAGALLVSTFLLIGK